jgi:hypothetical protein
MTCEEALAFVRQHGVVLASGKGPVPNVAEAIVDETIAGFTRDTRLSAS